MRDTTQKKSKLTKLQREVQLLTLKNCRKKKLYNPHCYYLANVFKLSFINAAENMKLDVYKNKHFANASSRTSPKKKLKKNNNK